MARGSLRKELSELGGGLEGWRLEPRTTPGASPLWCYLSEGKIELSVTAEGPAFVLYVMETDAEVALPDRDALLAWLSDNRPDALREASPRPEGKKRFRKFFEWE